MRLPTDAFTLLVKPIRKIIEEKGFVKPTEPQAQAIPQILNGKNILLIAPTGTGKTEAAFLPVFSKFLMINEKSHGIKILYITPLRSLNRDLLQRLEWWCEKLDIKVSIRHGDTDTKERTFQSKAPPDVLITTPETLQAIMPGRNLRGHLASVQWVIIDEIHEFAEDKRGSQLSLALERLRIITGREFQVIGLSATIGSPEKVASFLAGTNRTVEIVRVPVARSMDFQIIYPTPLKEDYALAIQLYTYPEVATRLRIMREIIENHKSVLLFTNTRSVAEILASRFKIWDINFPISIHHGSLAKTSRIAAETGLKMGDLKGLVCTSSLELGIDIGKIDMCIQYMSPKQVVRLVQRTGRSGHGVGRIAKGIIITIDSDDTLEAMIIARRAYLEELETVNIPEKPLDVLTHEIIGLFTQSRMWKFDQILDVFRKAYPYRDLTESDLISILTYLHERYPKLVWVSFEDKIAMRPKNTTDMYQFYYENLSMIPDEKNYLIVDETDETPLGILDEAFVAEYGDPGTKFIVRGSSWKIVSVYGDKIYVRPMDNPTGAIPSWSGEEIPVPFMVAKEVGEIRSFIEEQLEQKNEASAIADTLAKTYPADKDTIVKAIREVIEQFNKGYSIPTEKRIVIENGREGIIIHACLGSLVNRTLGTLLGHLLSEKIGYSVKIQEDPYRIMLTTDTGKAEVVRNLLYELSTMDLNSLAIETVKATRLFKRRIIHVARRFGAVSKWVDFNNISLQQLVKSFQGTAIFDEAVRETLEKDMDIQNLKEILKGIRNSEIEIVILETEEPTPLAHVGLEKAGNRSSLVSPERLQILTVESAKVRLLTEIRTFICAKCWGFLETIQIKELGESFSCPKCGSKRIGVVNISKSEAQQYLTKENKRLTAKQREISEYIDKTADLMEKYGTRSAFVLAGKNIRIQDVEEILIKTKAVEDNLFELIIEAERKALVKRFW